MNLNLEEHRHPISARRGSMALKGGLALAASAVLLVPGAGGATAYAPADPLVTDTATFINFIDPDPLHGDNGLPTSPAVDPQKYGPVNVPLDTDGNAIQGPVEGSIEYFDGKYYMYTISHACGSFDGAPGASTTATLPTQPAPSYYRACGMATYASDDLMNWTFLDYTIPQDPTSGAVYQMKKARVVHSEKTGKYVMWFSNGQGPGRSRPDVEGTLVMSSPTPHGPWSTPRLPENPLDPTQGNLLRDFDLGVGPDREAWMVKSHGEVVLYRLNDERDGIVEMIETGADTSIFGGGIGVHHENGWWYVTGSRGCGNCLGTTFAYIRSKDPRGPWSSPTDNPTTQRIEPTILSQDSGYAQSSQSVSVPDSSGKMRTFVIFKHYRSSKTGAPGTDLRQPGDASLALTGQWWYPLEYDDEGRILPMEIEPTSQFPLARPVRTSAASAYQPDLSITSERSTSQTWSVPRRKTVRTVLPSVFQRTPDTTTQGTLGGKGVAQEPLVDEPLTATLDLPDGSSQTWNLDPRTIAWSPQQVPLVLDKPFTGGGQMRLTLSTRASNGGYGVAVGSELPGGVYQHREHGTVTTFQGASMALRTSSAKAAAPDITQQPRDVTVLAGDEVGFVVQSKGIGVGYQWKRDGEILLAPDGYNESTARTFRRDFVTEADAGTYRADVFNTEGNRTSREVRLTVLDVAVESALESVGDQQVVTVSAANHENVPVDVVFDTEWGTRKIRDVAPGTTVEKRFETGRDDIVLGKVDVTVGAQVDGRHVSAEWPAYYGEPMFSRDPWAPPGS